MLIPKRLPAIEVAIQLHNPGLWADSSSASGVGFPPRNGDGPVDYMTGTILDGCCTKSGGTVNAVDSMVNVNSSKSLGNLHAERTPRPRGECPLFPNEGQKIRQSFEVSMALDKDAGERLWMQVSADKVSPLGGFEHGRCCNPDSVAELKRDPCSQLISRYVVGI